MPLPRISASMLAADVVCPRNGRASWMRASKGWIEPRSASIDSAAAMSAARASLLGGGQRQRQHRRRRLRAVDQRQPFLGAEADRRQAGALQRLRAGMSAGPRSQRSSVASRARVTRRGLRPRRSAPARDARAARDRRWRRPSRATARAGWTPAFSSAISASSVSDAIPGEALRQHVGAQRHRRADGAGRQRIAEPGGVAAQQVELQRLERVGRDLDVGERSEAGVDAVGRLVAARPPIDDGARRAHALARRVGQRDRLAAVRDGESWSSVSEEPSRRIMSQS